MESKDARLDHRIIFDLVEPGSKVLDLGCGYGDLMYILTREKNVRAQGIEVDDAAVYECVRKGLSVFHSDIETGLTEYPDRSFDYIILNQSMQEVRKADFIIEESLRVAGKVVVGFPNFAYIQSRVMLFCKGRSPITPSLPYRWYDTPNVRFLSISDFTDFCREKQLRVLEARYLDDKTEVRWLPNLRALNAIFMVARERETSAAPVENSSGGAS
ncbi:MAG TPA: methionine biosynthesis protein MetW [Rectinemataceae bacterium]|nr:methionine biosynthesis protein MetW [Rectinemataceae bacterium]